MILPTVGIIVGGINILACVIMSCYFAYIVNQLHEDYDGVPRSIIIAILFIFFFGIIFSVLLIIGIVKKTSKLMAPWVYLSLFGIGLNGMNAGRSLKYKSIEEIVFTMVLVVLQIALFAPVYILYRRMRSHHPHYNHSMTEQHADEQNDAI